MDSFDIIFILIVFYFVLAIAYKFINKISYKEAFIEVIPAVYGLLTNSNSSNREFTGDYILKDELCTALSNFDVRNANHIRCGYETYSKYNVPSIVLDFVPQNTTDFDKVKVVMEDVLDEHLAARCMDSPNIISVIEGGQSFIIHIMYATTPDSIEFIQKYMEWQAGHMLDKAIETVAPAIDKELEEDLDLFGGNGNGGTA